MSKPLVTLQLDPILCTAHGLCAQVLPELVQLDEWGFPIVSRAPVTDDLMRHARAAVRDCPVRALRLRRRLR